MLRIVLIFSCVLMFAPTGRAKDAPTPKPVYKSGDAIRQAVTRAIFYLRQSAHADPQQLFVAPIRQRQIVDWKVVEVRYSEKIIEEPIWSYEYETYETVAAVKKDDSAGGPQELQNVQRRRVKKRKQVGTREVKRLIRDDSGPIVREHRYPIYGAGGPDLLYHGFWGQNAACLLASLQAGVPPTDELVAHISHTLVLSARGYGLPDDTWDLAWLTVALAAMPRGNEQRDAVAAKAVNKLLCGQWRSGPAKGLWSPMCLDIKAIRRVMEAEKTFLADELRPLQAKQKKAAEKGKGRTAERYEDKVEECRAQLAKIHDLYLDLSAHSVAFENIQQQLTLTPPDQVMMESGWSIAEAAKPGMPYFMYGEATADVGTSTIVLFALRAAARAGLLPEQTDPVKDLEGNPMTKSVTSIEIILDGLAAICQNLRKTGEAREGNQWFPIDDFDGIGLPQLPLPEDRFKELESPSSAFAGAQVFSALTCGLDAHPPASKDPFLRQALQLSGNPIPDLVKSFLTDEKKGKHLDPCDLVVALSIIADTEDEVDWWRPLATKILDRQGESGNWTGKSYHECASSLGEYFPNRARWEEYQRLTRGPKIKDEKGKKKDDTPPVVDERRVLQITRSWIQTYGCRTDSPQAVTAYATMFLVLRGSTPGIGAWAWNDAPTRMKTIDALLARAKEEKNVQTTPAKIPARLTPAMTYGLGYLFISGHGDFELSEPDSQPVLIDYLRRGGVLIVEFPGIDIGEPFRSQLRDVILAELSEFKESELPVGNDQKTTVQTIVNEQDEPRVVFIPIEVRGREAIAGTITKEETETFCYDLIAEKLTRTQPRPAQVADWAWISRTEEALAAGIWTPEDE